jgi:hypothetical protein
LNPAFKIEVDGKDRTSNFSDLESITVTDEAGDKSDSLELTLDDEDQTLEIPRKKAVFKVWMGTENSLIEMGEFILDHTSTSGFPAKMTLFATASPFKSGFTKPKERSWYQNTVGQIVGTIAQEQGLQPAIDSELVKEKTEQIDQTQSDMHLLRWLSKKYDATFKVQAGHLIFVRKGRSASGFLPKMKVSKNILDNWTHETPPSGEYSGARAYYIDENSQRQEVLEGKDGKVYEIKFNKKSEEEARNAAKNKLREIGRGTSTLRFGLTVSNKFNPAELTSGQVITVSGIRNGIDTDWLISKISHTLSTDGSFVSQLDCESLQD